MSHDGFPYLEDTKGFLEYVNANNHGFCKRVRAPLNNRSKSPFFRLQEALDIIIDDIISNKIPKIKMNLLLGIASGLTLTATPGIYNLSSGDKPILKLTALLMIGSTIFLLKNFYNLMTNVKELQASLSAQRLLQKESDYVLYHQHNQNPGISEQKPSM